MGWHRHFFLRRPTPALARPDSRGAAGAMAGRGNSVTALSILENAKRVIVMYAGLNVEEATIEDSLERSATPTREACKRRSRASRPWRDSIVARTV